MPLDSGKKDVWVAKAFERFTGMNTGESPMAIGRDELSLLVNYIPIGNATLRKIPSYSNALTTIGSSETAWQATHTYSLSDHVIPTVDNGYIYKATAIGSSPHHSGTTEPTWPITALGAVTDGNITWTAYSLDIMKFFFMNHSGTTTIVAWTKGGALYKINMTSWVNTRIANAGSFSNPKFAQWKNERVLIEDPTAGYYGYDGTTLTIIDAAALGTSIEVFKGRVWIVLTNNTCEYSSADSYTDFSSADAGAFAFNYPNLKKSVTGMKVMQDYLYVFGDHAAYLISGITITTEGTTYFTITELDQHKGLYHSDTLQIFDNVVMFDTGFGIFGMSGQDPLRLSDELDGLTLGSLSPVGFVAQIYGIPVYGYLCSVANPSTNSYESWIAVLSSRSNKKRWFMTRYGLSIKYIATDEEAGSQDVYAAYDHKLIKIFDTSSTNPITTWLRTRSDDFGYPVNDKEITRLGLKVTSPQPLTVTALVQGEITDTVSFEIKGTIINPLNNAGNIIRMMNTTGTVLNIYKNQVDYTSFVDASGRGKGILVDIQETSAIPFTLQGIYLKAALRGDWINN